MKKQWVLVVLLMGISLGQPRRDRCSDSSEMSGGLRQQLDLSAEQSEELRNLRETMREESTTDLAEMRALRQELLELYGDPQERQRIASRIGEIHRQLTLRMGEHLEDIGELLTEEQMNRFLALRRKRYCPQ